jgi:hypothetical protein
MTKIHLDEFNKILKLAMNDIDCLRLGQSFYYYLSHEYQDIAEEIVGTKYDPFYVDDNLSNLFELIVERK